MKRAINVFLNPHKAEANIFRNYLAGRIRTSKMNNSGCRMEPTANSHFQLDSMTLCDQTKEVLEASPTAVEQTTDAADSFTRGISTLSRLLFQTQQAHEGLMVNLLKNHIELCESGYRSKHGSTGTGSIKTSGSEKLIWQAVLI
jgi:hypothetical protein